MNAAVQKFGSWQFVVLGLSVLVLVALCAQTFLPLSKDVSAILDKADTAICAVFLGDFFVRLIRAPNKLKFLKWGWIDFVSSIPMLDFMRWGRLVRMIRILRVLRGVRSAKVIIQFVFANRAKGTIASAAIISFVLIVACSIAVLQMEPEAEGANIKTAGDALWWSVVTITTVGYGDRFPVTAEGRVIGAVLMTAGVGLFGILSGFVAAWFVEGQARKEDWVTLEQLKADLDEIKSTLARTGERSGITKGSLSARVPVPMDANARKEADLAEQNAALL